ncbi:MAG TPA: transglutaminase family protein, partial [Phycisphaerae bacterium]|nr:transglutaminase family protein [Phycisphaerae bacterium]
SPIGFRLPLDSLPWTSPSERAQFYDMDPTMPREPLPPLDAMRRGATVTMQSVTAQPTDRVGAGVGNGAPRSGGVPPLEAAPGKGVSASWLVRTAMAFEPRDGHLFVFMPPVESAEDYLDLVAAVEDTAEELDAPVFVEGYAPPFDPRLNHFSVTPDPGVIEVNIHPSLGWREQVDKTEIVYEEARATRLGAQKFMLDGRHTGTGGGNHIVIGGATPADSPFLRRPDLLKSLVAYWHNHPALSYLFSGMFIGPTSQAPRVDEGRGDNIYELDIAMQQIAAGAKVPMWHVDRVFRNLLVDLTGNTHRAEFCIDKLYSPDSSSGRLGLVEFRGFEMPPHAEMSLTQQLLLRALITRFWEKPYTAPLVRWRTELHDRFMLPHFVAEDMRDVIRETHSAGIPIEFDWFAPHFEFRFPIHGFIDSPAAGGMHVELRQAIEPWHVLGEEPGGGGTVRYVDSSVERLQVKVKGLINSRHALAVNGISLPLHSTGRNGEFVCGIRYRAWQPPHCLHPTLPVPAPLVFDIVDQWNKQAIGGCAYHVSHPGGRSHDQFPINAFEAESRRIARFFKFGHTPGPLQPREVDRSQEYPFTLDLRRT